tara:strand:- start:991 stop:1401 length:411 start_codon:yes stop_codon:yes gene_type:complete
MQQKFSLTRKLIEEQPDDTNFEVFLKNGNKLTGKITNVSDRTFVITNGVEKNALRSLVYFSKISSTTPLKNAPAHYKNVTTTVDDNIGNRKSGPTITHKKPRNRLLRRDSYDSNVKSPSDIEQDRFYGNELTGTQG